MPITRHSEFGPHGDGTQGLPLGANSVVGRSVTSESGVTEKEDRIPYSRIVEIKVKKKVNIYKIHSLCTQDSLPVFVKAITYGNLKYKKVN